MQCQIWVQTSFLDLSQILPQGSKSLFMCVCTCVVRTCVCLHVCKSVHMCFFSLSTIVPQLYRSVGYLNSFRSS